MESAVFTISQLVEDDTIEFNDSEGMIMDKLELGKINNEQYIELIHTMNSPLTKQIVLDWKLKECSDTFIDSIRRAGILTPVAMMNNCVLNGHHRIAVAQHLGIDVPVDVYETFDEFDDLHQWETAGLVDCNGNRE